MGAHRKNFRCRSNFYCHKTADATGVEPGYQRRRGSRGLTEPLPPASYSLLYKLSELTYPLRPLAERVAPPQVLNPNRRFFGHQRVPGFLPRLDVVKLGIPLSGFNHRSSLHSPSWEGRVISPSGSYVQLPGSPGPVRRTAIQLE